MKNRRQFTFPFERTPKRGRPRLSASRRKRWHERRPEFDGARIPLQVTLKLRPGLPKLRGKAELKRIRRAISRSRSYGLRVVHYSILHNHIHFVVESGGKHPLTTQMKSLAITLARNLNKVWNRKGELFEERYHSALLTTPTRTRNALAYVLTNDWKHRGRRGRIRLNRYSTALLFENWNELIGPDWRKLVGFPEEYFLEDELRATTDPPRTWFLSDGWLRAR